MLMFKRFTMAAQACSRVTQLNRQAYTFRYLGLTQNAYFNFSAASGKNNESQPNIYDNYSHLT